MPQHKEIRIVPYTAKQMYDLVADIQSYPEFLPWVAEARLYRQKEDDLHADLTIGYKKLSLSYTSHVHFEPHKEIRVDYQHGPMKHLDNWWRFKELDNNHCEVDFFVRFDFTNPFFKIAMEAFFNEAVTIMVQAFEDRAKQIYT